MTNRSGTSRTYADRVAKGRPNVTFSMATDVSELISKLAARLNLSRSAVVEQAVRDLSKKCR